MYLIKLQTLILSTVYFTLEKDELCIKLSVYCPCDVITIITQYVVHNNNVLALKYEIIELALLMEHNKQETIITLGLVTKPANILMLLTFYWVHEHLIWDV